MFRWLNGPGNVFRQPLPGSTNYLNAYDRSGNLLRVDNSNVAQSRKSGDDEKKKDEGEDTEIDLETSSIKKKRAQRPSPEARMKGAPLPKETREDLMPFPMNREFRSQSVLSEQLKDAIYKKVTEQGKSVRDVSATLGVEMRRVAAVVRLKALEKEWEEQVCSLFLFVADSVVARANDEKTNSISLEDLHYGYQNNYNSLITLIPVLLVVRRVLPQPI